MRVVNINEADLDELSALPGITSELAMAIIDNIRMYGPYFDLDELGEDSGPLTAAQVDALRGLAVASVPE